MNEIDLNKVYESAKKAKIYDFIEEFLERDISSTQIILDAEHLDRKFECDRD